MLFAVYVLQPEVPLVIYHSSHDHGDKNGKRRKIFLRYLCCFALNIVLKKILAQSQDFKRSI
ncbi:hypothetical protein DU258_22455 [Salmonella enterica subsp. enterica]|uniref:Uncharacterized protein n=1 Tax=Salmonella enterica subsp. enterica serovar Macclesfield str. S-1643 TaxID=1242107 RepID=A0A2C9P2D8_SALET|nr:hypothetical protein LFZ25_16425 [Salmonella enterica subsp. enterica serovar Macclesfield str. S-1643]EAA5488054.1 hypothetical protein [Salmonella enterica subsp. enterica serovar Kouka]EAC1133434.1 hypothetical protein [Salmonella enterica subsp. enterica serovar Kambole]EBS1109535.1 hypothetical protein [Salmonella enterica subsp. enterica serovar Eingedi]EBV2194632.1 hypothetical protein [Salmonella enterica subsp. enterica serovar Afula]ECH9429912.1 hypothetical protein [Salmonella en